jgi:hypothetical protein
MFWMPLLGAGLGALQYQEQSKQAEAQRRLAATTAAYSPWTHLTPDLNIKDPSMLGTVGQGALTGAMMGAAVGEQNLSSAQTNLAEEQLAAAKAANAPKVAGVMPKAAPMAVAQQMPAAQQSTMQPMPWESQEAYDAWMAQQGNPQSAWQQMSYNPYK